MWTGASGQRKSGLIPPFGNTQFGGFTFAVSNSRSRNPISTRAKYRQLKRIAQAEPDGAQLLTLWDAAWRLHTYADQMPKLAALERDWREALEFIDGMLAMLPSEGAPDNVES